MYGWKDELVLVLDSFLLKARIRTSGGPYYHQFNRSSFIIV